MKRVKSDYYDTTVDNDGWPADVPVLTAGDICQGDFSDGKGRCCLLGWCRVITSGHPVFAVGHTASRHTLGILLSKQLGRDGISDGSLVKFNEDNSLDEVAAFWNRAMAREYNVPKKYTTPSGCK